MKKTALISLILFLIFVPLVHLIKFPINDEWIYYQTVQNFLKGDFRLDNYVNATFYAQGFLAAIFSHIFGISNIPYLTLAVSVANFFIFFAILHKKLKLDYIYSLLLALVYFFNPLTIYSTLGFMTENYFMFFLLLTFYFFITFEQSKTYKNLAITFIFAFLALNVRQVALLVPLAMFAYYIYKGVLDKKDFKANLIYAITSGFVFGLFYLYYFAVILTRNNTITDAVQMTPFVNYKFVFSLFYGILILLCSFLLPLIFSKFFEFKLFSRKTLVLILLTLGIYISLNYFFVPNKLQIAEYPYFKNIITRTGFYSGGIHGTKFQMAYNFKIYSYEDLLAKFAVALLFAYLIMRRKNPINFWAVFIVGYIALMGTTIQLYDRYFLVILPALIIYLATLNPTPQKIEKWLISLFLVFLIILAYQFSMDFVLTNQYVWNKSVQLATEKKLHRNMIQGTNAWKLSYRNLQRDYIYDFSYDAPEIYNYYPFFTIVQTKQIKFPFSLWINPKIYLYKDALKP